MGFLDNVKERIILAYALGLIKDKDFQRLTDWNNSTPEKRREDLGRWIVRKLEKSFPEVRKVIES
jgi:hypothetical protein